MIGISGPAVTNDDQTSARHGESITNRGKVIGGGLSCESRQLISPGPINYLYSAGLVGTNTLLRSDEIIAQRIAWRAEYDRAMLAATGPPPSNADVSAIPEAA